MPQSFLYRLSYWVEENVPNSFAGYSPDFARVSCVTVLGLISGRDFRAQVLADLAIRHPEPCHHCFLPPQHPLLLTHFWYSSCSFLSLLMSSSTLSSSLPSQPSDSSTPSKRPSQITFYRPAQMALFANITTFPPLSQVSVIPPSRREVCEIVSVRICKMWRLTYSSVQQGG